SAHPDPGSVGRSRGPRIFRVPRSPHERARDAGISYPGRAALAACALEAQPTGTPGLGGDASALPALDPDPPRPASLAGRSLRRQNPRQEPSALAAHARICAGGGPSWSSRRRRAVPTATGALSSVGGGLASAVGRSVPPPQRLGLATARQVADM